MTPEQLEQRKLHNDVVKAALRSFRKHWKRNLLMLVLLAPIVWFPSRLGVAALVLNAVFAWALVWYELDEHRATLDEWLESLKEWEDEHNSWLRRFNLSSRRFDPDDERWL